MISPKFRTLILCAVGAGLAGCSMLPHFGSSAPQPPPPPPVLKPIRSIAIVNVSEPQTEQILTVGSALSTNPDPTLSQPRVDYSNTYTQLLAARKTAFAPDLVKTLTTLLTDAGYRVTYLPDQKTFLSADGKSEDLTQVKTDADAILVIRFTGAGYVSSQLELSYQPWITMSARLIRTSNKQDVYQKTFSGGYQMTMESVSLPSSSKYRYPYFRDLTAAVDESIRGLKESVNDIAVFLGNDLFHGQRAEPLPSPPVTPPAPAPGADGKNAPAKAPADAKAQ